MNAEAQRTLACPSCRGTMMQLSLPGKIQQAVDLDLCFACQGIWFDQWESYQIAPLGIIELFRHIHDHQDDLRLALADPLRCPRCSEKLIKGLDVAKSGRFSYHRCPQAHGRFTVFGQFMIEKGFVRQLSRSEINELAEKIGIIHCTGCGAPVDIRTDAACPHCRAPIAILDPQAVQHALEHYAKETSTEVSPAHIDQPTLLAETILAAERMKNQREREAAQSQAKPLGDLISAGVELVWRAMRP